jgi:hypothetical protein
MKEEAVRHDATQSGCILVEGPWRGDAHFYGNWLLCAARVNEIVHELKNSDADFRRATETIEIIFGLDFGISATVFLRKLADTTHVTFTIDTASQELIDFVLMAEMGFFSLTGERYQMTLPSDLDAPKVKKAHLKLADTEDDEWIHPELLVAPMSCSRAKLFQSLLGKMNPGHRMADRRALLYLD